MKNMQKIMLLLASTSLVLACQGRKPSEASSSEEKQSSVINESSKEDSSKQPVSESSKESELVSSSINQPSSESSLESNPGTCTNHTYQDTIKVQPTLLERGILRKECTVCNGFEEQYIYKLDEYAFKDVTYQYDGNERELLIEGVLPYGTTVEYENNKIKDIGQKEATARIYDSEHNLLDTKTAKISIIENIGLPVIKVVTTDGEDPDYHSEGGEHPYKDMTASIENCNDSYKLTNVAGQIKVRGNSTNQSGVGKRAFRFKFNSKVNLLGLNDGIKEKSWVVLADFFDQSNFRNATAFEMGNSLFNYSGYYTSDYQHVTLYMNGENRGVYLLAEQQHAKKSRIPVNEPEETETGTNVGYLVEIDGLVQQQGHIDSQTGLGTLEGDPCFQSDSAGKVNNVSISAKPYVIKTDTWNDEQRLFIKKYISNCTKAFANICNGTLKVVDQNAEIIDSPYDNAYDSLNAFIDVDSFMRMYLLQEYLKDYDVGWGSFYMYVDFSTKSTVKRLTMSAPWDFDLGLGDKQSSGSWGGWGGWGGQGQSSSSDKDIPSSGISSTKDDFLSGSEYTSGMTTFNPWLYMLSQTNFFKEMFKKYYSIFANSDIYQRMMNNIAYERVAFLDSFNDNHQRYVLDINSSAFNMQTRRYDTFKDAVDYLEKWLSERKEYLDSKYLS